MELDKEKKKVLITGGSGGIAQAIKTLLEEDGYKVLAPTRTEMDVTDWNSIESVIKDFVPDILINNAGYVVPQSIKKMDLENTKKHFDINIGGTFYCTGIALKYNPNLVEYENFLARIKQNISCLDEILLHKKEK